MFDLVLANGTVIDPAHGRRAGCDVAFTGGRVAAVAPGLGANARAVVDCAGRLVAPGLVDMHTHLFPGASHYGLPPDPFCVARGVTTAIDAGSAGADGFERAAPPVIAASRTRVRAFLHISRIGMVSHLRLPPGATHELGDPALIDVAAAVAAATRFRDWIVGVKVRLTAPFVAPELGIEPLRRAVAAAERLGLPVMVHPQQARCGALDDVLAALRPGDILTHCYHPVACGILGDDGRVRPAVFEAAARGVLFDVGHGQGSFSWTVAERALAEGLRPRTISSDGHSHSIPEPAGDLARTLSRFLALGLSVDEVIAMATAAPARALGLGEGIGTLAPGATGDAVVLEERRGAFELGDSGGERRTAPAILVVKLTVRAGAVVATPETDAGIQGQGGSA